MQELKTMLEQLNIPVAYSHFNTATTPPFICFYRDSTANFGADNKVYKKINNYTVELYTEYKNTTLEEQLEDIFDANNVFYNVQSEDYIDAEQVYQIIYTITLENENVIASI